MKRSSLSREERSIEEALIKGEYQDVGEFEFQEIAQAIASRRKDAVLNIRVNGRDLQSLKSKARKYGIRYQAFISELIHRVAQG